jgi:lactoylglutathione lyase
MSASLCLLVIRSADLDRAEAFYRGLGIEFRREKHGRGPIHLAAETDVGVFEIYPLDSQSPTAGVRLGFRVFDLDGSVRSVKTFGGIVERPPMLSAWGRRAVVRDPDGHTIELLETAA